MAENSLTNFLGSIGSLIKRKKEAKEKEERAVKIRKALAGIGSGLNIRGLTEQGISSGLGIPEATKQAEKAAQGYVPAEDPRFQFLTSQDMNPPEKLKMMQYLYQLPLAKKGKDTKVEYTYKGLPGKGGKELSDFEKVQKRMDYLRKELKTAWDKKQMEELKEKLA